MEVPATDAKDVSLEGVVAAGHGGAAVDVPDKTARRTGRDPQKNRVVQARYRQRIKEKATNLAAAHEAAAADVERARQEGEDLRSKNAALEGILQVRSSWAADLEMLEPPSTPMPLARFPLLRKLFEPMLLRFKGLRAPSSLSQQQQPQQPAVPHARNSRPEGPGSSGSRSGAAAESWSTAQGAAEVAGPPAATRGAAVVAGASPQSGCVQSFLCEKDPLQVLARQLGASMAATAQQMQVASSPRSFESIEVLRAIHDSVGPQAVTHVERLTLQQLQHGWRLWQNRLRRLLAEYDVTRSEDALADIKSENEQWAVLIALVVVHNPGVVQQHMAASQEGLVPEEEEREQWDQLVASLEFTKAQRERYIKILDEYCEQMAKLEAHRERAVQMLRAMCGPGLGSAHASEQQLEAVGLTGMMAKYLHVWDSASSLDVVPDLEFVATMEFTNECSKMWTPLQKARILVLSDGSFPDCIKLIQAVKRMPADASPTDESPTESASGSAPGVEASASDSRPASHLASYMAGIHDSAGLRPVE